MQQARFFLSLLFVLFLFGIAIQAQSNEQQIKEKLQLETKLLEQVLEDARSLRLPENRAFVYARVGNAFWKIDQKYARKLFQDSVAELLSAQAEVETLKGNRQYMQNLLYGQSPRLEIVNFIAVHDAEYALEVLVKTRPARLSPDAANIPDLSGPNVQTYARNEIQTEQKLIGLAAEQNPELAVKRVRESLKKGATYETLNLLRKIHSKDEKTGHQLAEEVAQKFLGTDFSKNYQGLEILGYFLNEMGRERSAEEKAPKISDQLVRALANRMIDYWLGQNVNQFYGYWNAKTVLEKLIPERAEKVRQKIETNNALTQSPDYLEYNKLTQGNLSAEELFRQAEKISPVYRNEIYRIAADKFAQDGNVAQAEKILSENISAEYSAQYVSQLYSNLANQMTYSGKFSEAKGLIAQIPEEHQRITALIGLAQQIYYKDIKANQKAAIDVLNEARALLPEIPETETELSSLIYLSTAFSQIEPQEAFQLIEAITPTLNEIQQANFVMAKFRNYGGVRQGEMQIFTGYNLGVYNLETVLKALRNSDLERSIRFTNGFNRPENRILLQLQLIDENLAASSNLITLTSVKRN